MLAVTQALTNGNVVYGTATRRRAHRQPVCFNLFNPGANLFVVVQTSTASGRRAGVMTGLGVALGDAFYSGLGLLAWQR